MFVAITRDIKITVESYYQEEYSNPKLGSYLYAYRITIVNQSNHIVQLLKRHWYIKDSFGTQKEVVGDGVIGETPIIHPNQSYKYISGCNLSSDFGQMHGTYLMQKVSDGKTFKVNIPHFSLIAPYKLN
ncbi:MAG: Co2+/Mg2+ efflux protein ApaG [Chitinophagales bacterium]|nr:Co2+/Mg2+ efflux protein ApaG [Chitinophagales bacterium]MCZ2393002.1 Co2+/Mg2+ efflux protein ApaG [Chitinophagales bacterium]